MAPAWAVAALLPDLVVDGILGDFSDRAEMAELLSRLASAGPLALFFPGSTIGNFDRSDAARLLSSLAAPVPAETPLVLGVDLIKETAVLEAAYDDAAGVTAAFNRNLLNHLNERFGANFEPSRWRHVARWVPEHARIEMWLLSDGPQSVDIGGRRLSFAAGEGIHTENSHKWNRSMVELLASSSGWRLAEWWTDDNECFAEALLVRRDQPRR